MFALSFTALFLELMLIRWVPTTVRLVAYYANLLLISSFLGLGIGAMFAKGGRDLFRYFPLVLLINVGTFWLCGKGDPLSRLGSEARFFAASSTPMMTTSAAHALLNYAILVAVFAANTILFIPIGQEIGRRFRALPPLRAYAWDLGGSLLGTLCFGAFSLTHFSPLIGLCFVLGVYLCLADAQGRAFAIVAFPLIVVAVVNTGEPRATWSPYHFITAFEEMSSRITAAKEAPADIRTMRDPPSYVMRVGLDFYQVHATIDESRYTPNTRRAFAAQMRRVRYMLPYEIAKGRERIAVLGAGGGLDVEAALMAGARHVDAVEIDRTLVALSHRMSAANVYDDPRVSLFIDDARGRLRAMPGDYDLIVLGYLDSQSLFSTMSNLRLDGYIYTVESMKLAFDRLRDGGAISLSFACATDWMPDKLAEMLRRATGVDPICYRNGSDVALLVFKNGAQPSAPPPPESFEAWHRIPTDHRAIDPPTDDWPYLYLRERAVPRDYAIVIGVLVIGSIIAVSAIRGRQGLSRSDSHFFFLGVAFLLLQTKGITDCSLYFGATWLVTTIVITGVLLMVLLANLVATRLVSVPRWLYVPLIASLLLLHFVPRDVILSSTWSARLAWALVVVPLPIFFAGLIFSTSFREAEDPAAAFGANLIGATIGGFSEYLGMALGTHALGWIVLAAYLASALFRRSAPRIGAT